MLIKKSLFAAGVTVAALTISAAAVASSYSNNYSTSGNSGFVVGIQGGYADLHWDNLFNVTATDFLGSEHFDFDTKDTGFAARGFVGYNINQYFGLETGYTYLPKTTFGNVNELEIKTYAIDLLAKLSVPVTPVFNVYAKAGGSYLSSKIEIPSESRTNTHFGPAFGVGAAYEVVPNLAIDLSWMRFSGQGEIGDNYQPSPDVALLGISYKFPTNFS